MKKRAFAHSWVDKIGVLFFLEAGDKGQGGHHSDGVAAFAIANGGCSLNWLKTHIESILMIMN